MKGEGRRDELDASLRFINHCHSFVEQALALGIAESICELAGFGG